MKANELRILNYVKSNNPIYRKDEFGKYLNILAINDDSATVTVIENNKPIGYTFGQLYKYIEPIHLTEEILLKCGAWTSEWDNNSSYRIEITIDYVLVINLELNTCQLGDLDLKPIKYLHQLQNLYFALTGEELTINL